MRRKIPHGGPNDATTRRRMRYRDSMTATHPAATAYRSRIVGHGDADPATLTPNPRNFRTHPKPQRDSLAGVLAEVGYVQSVVFNRTTDRLIDGHLRVEEAIRNGDPTIPVVYVELDESEEALVLATLDPLAAMAEANAERLDALLRDVTTGSAAVQSMLADLAAAAIPLFVLGAGDSVDVDERAGSSPWGRVQGSDTVRCLIGDVEFGVPPDQVAAWTDRMSESGNALKAEAASWFERCVSA